MVPRGWLLRKPWFNQYSEKTRIRNLLANQLKKQQEANDSGVLLNSITYATPNRVKPSLFGLYHEETLSVYIILEASPAMKEVNLNKFLALHMNHIKQTPEEFYTALANNKEYDELIKSIRAKTNKVGARLRYNRYE